MLRTLARILSPFSGVNRIKQRSYDGAAGGRRCAGFAEQPHANSAIHAARLPIMRRARGLYSNNAYARAAVNAWQSTMVGAGIKLRSSHADDTVRERLSTTFERWTDDADADGRTDFYGLQALIVLHLVRDGEAFVTMSPDASGALTLRVIDPDQVDSSITRDLGGGAFVLQGIEFDASGQRVAYHVREVNPGLPFVSTLRVARVPAEHVLHIFRSDTTGQVRGMSWFAPILLRLADYDAAIDAQLVRQKIAALLCGFVTDLNGDAGGFAGEAKNGILDGGLEPGTLKLLAPGQDYKQSDPAAIGSEAIEFLRVTSREIAAGIGLPSFLLDGDFSTFNFASSRAALLEHRRRVEAHQFSILVYQLLRPVWRRWVTLEILSGRFAAPDFFRNPEAYLGMRAVMPRFEWVDPLKDVNAEIRAINARLMSRSAAVAARGLDVEQLDREIASDQARAKRLGLAEPEGVAP